MIQLLSTHQYYTISHSDSLASQLFQEDDSKKNTNKNTQDSKSNQFNLKLFNFQNVQYTGPLSIGDPDNTFEVIYDTGSANIWIDSKQCSDIGCRNRKQYDHQKSSNYHAINLQLDVQFGTGELIGNFSQDTVYFGGVEIEKQDFIEIQKQIGAVFQDAKFDGIVGLAFPSMVAYNRNSLFDNLAKSKKISKNIISFYMSNNAGSSDSQLTIGGYDKNKVLGQIHSHKIVKQYYWIFKADNILVGKKDIGLCKGGCYLIADTGTSLITGPSDSIYNLLNHLNVNDNCSNMNSLGDITFIADGVEYNLKPEEYILKDDDAEMFVEASIRAGNTMKNKSASCMAGFMPLDIPNDEDDGFKYEKAWILGDIFLKKYVSIYDRDNNTVSFGVANHSSI
ncbi:hypothetical protein IMG5_122010 [Ichthyophthirius multifiliis]|uniref:Peptidase A1 domain-containing protein n=1 Tax=Ichthyophthirius multifiliis TaxID=5932 RepID=G0QV86_ICHMU|nr:hypothetical protein IMG5_122010 [Ichthyophthirius multifiliis]EGR30870.1 hypothetical protein IMG5_122010 [Ichthyophthirius multifiliis]|eukprot:XP_004032457.1 hypothetical protein IMG5_122010 [Ichthyophthirius multifiliis]